MRLSLFRSLTIDGVKKVVALEGGNYNVENQDDLDALALDLEKAINTAFGWEGDDAGNTVGGIKRVQVKIENNRLTIQPAASFNKVPITLNSIKDDEDNPIDNILSTLGFDDGASYGPLNLHTSLKDQLSLFSIHSGPHDGFDSNRCSIRVYHFWV